MDLDKELGYIKKKAARLSSHSLYTFSNNPYTSTKCFKPLNHRCSMQNCAINHTQCEWLEIIVIPRHSRRVSAGCLKHLQRTWIVSPPFLFQVVLISQYSGCLCFYSQLCVRTCIPDIWTRLEYDSHGAYALCNILSRIFLVVILNYKWINMLQIRTSKDYLYLWVWTSLEQNITESSPYHLIFGCEAQH